MNNKTTWLREATSFVSQYWYLVVGFIIFPLVPTLFRVANNYLPVKPLAEIFGVIEVIWDLTFAATLIAFGLGNWLLGLVKRTTSLCGKLLIKPWQRVLVVNVYVVALVAMIVFTGFGSWYFWSIALAPALSLAIAFWDNFKSVTVLKEKVAGARNAASRNKWGQRFFYFNRVAAFAQPNLVFGYLLVYLTEHGEWQHYKEVPKALVVLFANALTLLINFLTGVVYSLYDLIGVYHSSQLLPPANLNDHVIGVLIGFLVVVVYVISDNWSTWSFFKTFRILINPTKERANGEVSGL